jgi:hypothetical protein
MRKFILSVLAAVLVLSMYVPNSSVVQASEIEISDTDRLSMQNQKMIQEVMKYVQLNEDGTVSFKDNVPKLAYAKYQLSDLQKHFDVLNEGVLNDTLRIEEDFEVTEIGISPMASYGSWDYHLWGYDRNFNNSQAIQYASDLELLAITGYAASYLFPPVAGIAGLTATYYLLLSNRVTANNKGKGVYVAVTWIRVFDVEPL